MSRQHPPVYSWPDREFVADSIHSFAVHHDPPLKYEGMRNALDVLTASWSPSGNPQDFHYEIKDYRSDGVFIQRMPGRGHRTTALDMRNLIERRQGPKADTRGRRHAKGSEDMAAEEDTTEKMIDFWMAHTEGTEGERRMQLVERIRGLDLACRLREMESISAKLHAVLDFDEMYRMVGRLCRPSEAVANIMGDEILTRKLMDIWTLNVEGTKAQMCQQTCERILGLLSLAALPETKPIFDELWQKLEFDTLYWMAASLGITSFWGPDTYLEWV